MISIHRITSTAAAFIAAFTALAFNITGVVVDESGEPLSEASARLLTARDSAYVKGGAADFDGRFTLTGINRGRYLLETSYVGYSRHFTPVTVNDRNVALDTIRMAESSHMLAETVVTGVKTPIKVMEDTIEYNADTYRTQPNAVVEDLLKRLPGVEVDKDGKITANGKEVTKILVDGKEFFGDDPKVASKNLPVEMVDKLQVVDRKSDLARLTGVDDGEDETVINLRVKKGMQNGWFGTVEGGYGTDDRYLATFNVNRFWNGNQITFIGNANNTNQMGFTDGNGSRFRRFGGDQGVTNSQSFGVNFNVGREEIIRVGGDVMYSHSDKISTQRQQREYLLEAGNYIQNSLTDARDRGHNVRADFRVEWKPDSFNTLDFRPRFSYNQNNSTSDAFSVAADRYLSLNRSSADGKAFEASGRLIYNHNFNRRRGRALSVFADYQFSRTHEYDDSYVFNRYYQFEDSLDNYDQWIDNLTWANSIRGRITWTEPIGNVARGNFITFGYDVRMRWNNADKLVYNRNISFADDPDTWHYVIGGNQYDVAIPIIDVTSPELNDTLSNSFRNTNFQQNFRLGYKKVSKNMTLDAGVQIVPIKSKSINLTNADKTIPERWSWNFSPFLRMRYKINTTTTLNFHYNGRSQQPSMTQLQPVADYTNPLNIVIGNPELMPSFNHNIHVRFQSFNTDAQRSIMAMGFATIEQNSIISKTMFSPLTGGRTTTYENVNGVVNARLMTMFSQPLRNKHFTFNNHLFLNYRRQIGYSNGERNVSNTFMFNESFSFAYRPEHLELELRPRYMFQTVGNSIASLARTNVHNFGGEFNASYYFPFGLVLATDLTYNATRGYADGYNENSWMWNASISYQFLKNRQASIMVKAYDILQQKKDISRTITANYIDDTQYNALTRYLMVTFTYKFNSFAGGAMPEDRNARGRFGPPPGGGPGGRPPRP